MGWKFIDAHENTELMKMKQPLMRYMERLREETHCAYEKEFIRGEDGRYTLWIHKLSH